MNKLLIPFILLFSTALSSDPRMEARGCFFHAQPNAGNAADEIFLEADTDDCFIYVNAADQARGIFYTPGLSEWCDATEDGAFTAFGVTLDIGESFTTNNWQSGAVCTLVPGNGNTYTSDSWTSSITLSGESDGTCVYKVGVSCSAGERE